MRRMMLSGIAMSWLLAGCGGGVPLLAPGPPKPMDVEVSLVAAADVNPNRQGRASPIVVHLFVLKDSGAFDDADIDTLTGDPATALGAALLAHEQRIVRPGESALVTLKIDPAATYVGTAAEYADALGAQWRAGIAAPEKRLLDLLSSKAIKVDLGRNAVKMVAE